MVDPFKQCPFQILKLPVTATEDEIIRQWKQLVIKNHPDKNSGEHAKENTQALNDAKDRALKHARDAREYKKKQYKEEERKKRKEEETRKRKQEEDERLRKEKEEDERLCKKEEECMSVLETIWPFMVENMDKPGDRMLSLYTKLDKKKTDYITTKGLEHITTKDKSNILIYGATYDMAEEIKKHYSEAQNAKTNTERLESALVEAKKELEAEHISKNDLAKRMSEAATLLF